MYLDFEAGRLELGIEVSVLGRQKGDLGVFVAGRQHVAQRHVLEAFRLANVVICKVRLKLRINSYVCYYSLMHARNSYTYS